MQQELPIEQRVFILENKLAELEARQAQKERDQSDIDIALLRRIDSFIGDLHRIERDQRKSFDELKAGQKGEAEILKDHKAAIESLAAGQQQIIALLTGSPPRND